MADSREEVIVEAEKDFGQLIDFSTYDTRRKVVLGKDNSACFRLISPPSPGRASVLVENPRDYSVEPKWPKNVLWPDGEAPLLPPGTSLVTFHWDGAHFMGATVHFEESND